jgi:hygromycin-B 7''-O-kinase
MEHTFIVMESSYYGFLGHGHGHGHVYGPRIQGQALGARHAAHGGPPALLASIERFTRQVREAAHGPLFPLHTELSELHVYAEERRGQLELSGLLDFADARIGPAQYELGCLVEFLFRGEPGLLRELLLAYGVPEAELTASYSENLLAWCLCGRFSNLNRVLRLVAPWVPESLEALAARLFALGPA